jgi:signal transduction histidine kinase
VLRNLLVNALRHTPVGGSVAVSAFQSGKAL